MPATCFPDRFSRPFAHGSSHEFSVRRTPPSLRRTLVVSALRPAVRLQSTCHAEQTHPPGVLAMEIVGLVMLSSVALYILQQFDGQT